MPGRLEAVGIYEARASAGATAGITSVALRLLRDDGFPGDLALTSPGASQGMVRRRGAPARRSQPYRHSDEPCQLVVQPVAHLLVGGIADAILQLVGILLEIVELIAVVVMHPVDELMACGPYRFVRHADEPWHGALAIVLNQERGAPVLSHARQQRHQ